MVPQYTGLFKNKTLSIIWVFPRVKNSLAYNYFIGLLYSGASQPHQIIIADSVALKLYTQSNRSVLWCRCEKRRSSVRPRDNKILSQPIASRIILTRSLFVSPTKHTPPTVVGVVLISSCGHAQVDNLQFQPINGQSQQPETSSPTQSFNNNNAQSVQPAATTGHIVPQFPGANALHNQSPVVSLDSLKFQQIVSGSEKFALELFSVGE